MTTTLAEDAALREQLELIPEDEEPPIELTNSITVPHTIHVVAVDAAGNRMESEEVLIYVIHKQEEEEQPEAANWDISIERQWAFVRREDEIVVSA